MAKPAARVSDPTSCPIPGHGPQTIAEGSPDVNFDGLPAARGGDSCTCGSALSSGLSSTVFINGKNAAIIGTGGTHGDIVIGGSATVIIGDSHTPAPFTPPIPLNIFSSWISFSIPGTESYAGLPCTAHFDDGTTLTGVFDANNIVKFANTSGKICQKLDFDMQDSTDGESILDAFLTTLK